MFCTIDCIQYRAYKAKNNLFSKTDNKISMCSHVPIYCGVQRGAGEGRVSQSGQSILHNCSVFYRSRHSLSSIFVLPRPFSKFRTRALHFEN